ncbi:MAG: DUF3244 domain-containing protein [Bacteroidaceae bacterium]|nr:DUF3244 domain-containing protein [Bacteroidaceae bacterium]
MNRKTLLACMVMAASIIPFSSIMVANDNTPDEEKVIELTNDNNGAVNDKTIKIPVTATLANNVLNVQFTGTVPAATVSVSNALTGATVAQQSITAMSGSLCRVPVSSGTYVLNVTNEQNGVSVSGVVDVEE